MKDKLNCVRDIKVNESFKDVGITINDTRNCLKIEIKSNKKKQDN